MRDSNTAPQHRARVLLYYQEDVNNLRRRILPTETQKEIVRAHKDQYITRWKTFPSGKKFGYVALKYTDAIQRIADARKQQRSGSYTRRYSGNSAYSNGGNSGLNSHFAV